MSILVIGGTGFAGRAVCRAAVQRGVRVASLSRRGVPDNLGSAAWMTKVDWRVGNSLDPISLEDSISQTGTTAIIHCVGSLVDSSAPAILRQIYQTFKADTSLRDMTHDQSIRETASNAMAAAANSSTARSFVLMSAAFVGSPFDRLPVLSSYVAAKRTAEDELAHYPIDVLRTVALQLGPMYSEEDITTQPVAALFGAAALPNRVVPGLPLPNFPSPIHVHLAAQAAVECALNSSISGVIPPDQVFKVIDGINAGPEYDELLRKETPTTPPTARPA